MNQSDLLLFLSIAVQAVLHANTQYLDLEQETQNDEHNFNTNILQ